MADAPLRPRRSGRARAAARRRRRRQAGARPRVRRRQCRGHARPTGRGRDRRRHLRSAARARAPPRPRKPRCVSTGAWATSPTSRSCAPIRSTSCSARSRSTPSTTPRACSARCNGCSSRTRPSCSPTRTRSRCASTTARLARSYLDAGPVTVHALGRAVTVVPTQPERDLHRPRAAPGSASTRCSSSTAFRRRQRGDADDGRLARPSKDSGSCTVSLRRG